MAKKYPDEEVSTVFLGGGTPSVVPASDMAGVLNALTSAFHIQKNAEFTAEANPGTLTPEWLEVLRGFGLNRLSLGVQAAQNHLLRAIGRIHTFEEATAAVLLAKSAGISNLNVDAMFGLPGQTVADYRETLDALIALEPKHISAYSLILEQGTELCKQVSEGAVTLPTDDETADMYELGRAQLAQQGYHQYEVSNFALNGYECRHNIGYWQDAWYLGLGLAAHSMLPPTTEAAQSGAVRMRRANTSDLSTYMQAMGEGKLPMESEQPVTAGEAMFETMMLGLRMTDGVSEAHFQATHGVSMRSVYGEALDGIARDGLGEWHNGCFRLTPRGLMMENSVLMRLMG